MKVNPSLRKIIHIDMDAFYASVEQRDFPEYKGKPIGVGGLSDRGVLATASYEARRFGVRSAMPTVVAKQKCPQLILVKPRFEVYTAVSHQIRKIFEEYTDKIEPLSLDEAYLDVTQNHKGIEIATDIAKEIKQRIWEETQLTASAGVSYNKFLAKIASDFNKPNGLFVITPKKAPGIIDKLPIERFHGIGKVTAEKMRFHGIFKGADLKLKSKDWLVQQFGKVGSYYFNVAHGQDYREVEANSVRKSVGAENTFLEDLTLKEDMQMQLQKSSKRVWDWVSKKKIYGRTVTLKMKFNDFTVITRSKSSLSYIKTFGLFDSIISELLDQTYNPDKPVRLLGVSLSNLSNVNITDSLQLELDFDVPID